MLLVVVQPQGLGGWGAIKGELQPEESFVKPEGAGQLGVFLIRGFSSESLHQRKGSINTFIRKKRECWPWDSINGRDRLSLARRNTAIPGNI